MLLLIKYLSIILNASQEKEYFLGFRLIQIATPDRHAWACIKLSFQIWHINLPYYTINVEKGPFFLKTQLLFTGTYKSGKPFKKQVFQIQYF